MHPPYWDAAQKHLSAVDPAMKKLVRTYKGEMMKGRGDAFYTLARSIVGQQISVKAADSVWAKFEGHVKQVKPKKVLSCDEEGLRGCGLSRQKVLYLYEISKYFLENKADEVFFQHMGDDEVIRSLSSIKGIGKWTAEMFLIFHLQRPDVLPLDDIGLQRGIERLYNGSEKMNKKQFVAIAEPWRPYRSVATWYLWRSLDPVPVEY